MAGFCKFYNENADEESMVLISSVLVRRKEYLNSQFF